jgi:hypothetical protein
MSKNTTLLVLGLASIVLSRSVFLFVNDPEGPNLLVVMVLAAVIFAIAYAVYAAFRRIKRTSK